MIWLIWLCGGWLRCDVFECADTSARKALPRGTPQVHPCRLWRSSLLRKPPGKSLSCARVRALRGFGPICCCYHLSIGLRLPFC